MQATSIPSAAEASEGFSLHLQTASKVSTPSQGSRQKERPRPLALNTLPASPPSAPQSPRRRNPFPSPSNSDDEHTFELYRITSPRISILTEPVRPSSSRYVAAILGELPRSLNIACGDNTSDYSQYDHRGRGRTMAQPAQDSHPLLEGIDGEKHEQDVEQEHGGATPARRRGSESSISSASTTSLVLENLNELGEQVEKERFLPKRNKKRRHHRQRSSNGGISYRDSESDPEIPRFLDKEHDGAAGGRDMSKILRRAIILVGIVSAGIWGAVIVIFLLSGRHKDGTYQYNDESPRIGSGRKVTIEQIQRGEWHARTAPITWIDGPNGEDGLVLEVGASGREYVIVEDIRSRAKEGEVAAGGLEVFKEKMLMASRRFTVDGTSYIADSIDVSPDMKKLLVLTKREKVFRHSYTGLYFVLDVESQTWEPLDSASPTTRVQLAQWSPNSDAIAFTRDNNLFVRIMSSSAVRQITDDGGSEYFYGIPDWVYEEEVFSDRVATWWSRDGEFVAFLRTNETAVPDYPVEYFIARPSGQTPEKGLEHYPETKLIKYPKSGAPNPVVDLLFYDVKRNEHFEVEVSGGFKDDNRLITNVLWTDGGKALIQEANRVSDRIRYVYVDVAARTGRSVREIDLKKEGLGWVEPGQKTTYIPADPSNGRPSDGYLAVVPYEGYDHIAYYTPIENTKPTMLTSGKWEVGAGPSAVDLKNNLVYFTSTAVAITQRHLFSVSLTKPKDSLTPITAVTTPGYWSASFSSLASYISLNYLGPSIPYQKVISALDRGSSFSTILESNEDLAQMANTHELPQLVYTNLTVNNATLQILERRPPHFDAKRQYPVVFYQYSGPNSQEVARRFAVDFQSYLAANQGYIVVTVDGRGTGFSGLEHRKVLREHFGTVEPTDQIAVAKHYAAKDYVDTERMAIWGWSYGGYTTLKTLELDAGETFHYGMAVAPVTDWAFYDSIYTERYMLTPAQNPEGYAAAKVSNVTALGQNVRFLIMHGTGDDNVHMQNTLTLLDELDLAGIGNYDVHFWPDSDHSIYFHGANKLVYERLSAWLGRAFRGEFYGEKGREKEMGMGEKRRDPE